MTTILLVDDSEIDRRLASGLLKNQSDYIIHLASDGAAGLEQVDRLHPDLVLTDMQMPKVDGLELVTALRENHPGIPVILMTAHGSEQLAVRALELGAASYVPKSQLASRLVETVEDVLAIMKAERSYARLISYLGRGEFEFVLENDPSAIDPLIDLVQQMAGGMRLCNPREGYRMSLALKEALLNALYRGNLELPASETVGDHAAKPTEMVRQRLNEAPYRNRRIYVDAQLSPDEAEFTVRDEGPGFNVADNLPMANEDLDVERGRGLVLMMAFMDEVEFNEAGNEVRMVKRRS